MFKILIKKKLINIIAFSLLTIFFCSWQLFPMQICTNKSNNIFSNNILVNNNINNLDPEILLLIFTQIIKPIIKKNLPVKNLDNFENLFNNLSKLNNKFYNLFNNIFLTCKYFNSLKAQTREQFISLLINKLIAKNILLTLQNGYILKNITVATDPKFLNSLKKTEFSAILNSASQINKIINSSNLEEDDKVRLFNFIFKYELNKSLNKNLRVLANRINKYLEKTKQLLLIIEQKKLISLTEITVIIEKASKLLKILINKSNNYFELKFAWLEEIKLQKLLSKTTLLIPKSENITQEEKKILLDKLKILLEKIRIIIVELSLLPIYDFIFSNDEFAITALKTSIVINSQELIKLLIDSGIDINIQNISINIDSKNTPLDLALELNREKIAEILIQAGARSNNYLYSKFCIIS